MAHDDPQTLFWDLVTELRFEDGRVEEGTIMGGRCVRVLGEFLALVGFQGGGMVVKLPRDRVTELVREGVGEPFAPAGKIFKEWVALPEPDPERWAALLREGVRFVAPRLSPRHSPAAGKDPVRVRAGRDRDASPRGG